MITVPFFWPPQILSLECLLFKVKRLLSSFATRSILNIFSSVKWQKPRKVWKLSSHKISTFLFFAFFVALKTWNKNQIYFWKLYPQKHFACSLSFTKCERVCMCVCNFMHAFVCKWNCGCVSVCVDVLGLVWRLCVGQWMGALLLLKDQLRKYGCSGSGGWSICICMCTKPLVQLPT